MKKRYYFFIVIISYFLFLLITVPVNSLLNTINNNTPVKIYNASGTIWHGEANSLTINKIANLTDTEWDFKPWKLFTGRIAFQIITHYDEQEITSEIGVSFLKQFFVNNLSARVSADNIAKLANVPMVELAGMIIMDIEHAHWKMNQLPLAAGNINWQQANITVTESVSLGELTIVLSETDQHFLNAEINNKNADILLSGNAELVPEADYAVNIKLSPTATASDNIKNSLSLFSEPQNDGNFLLKKSGQLNQLGLF